MGIARIITNSVEMLGSRVSDIFLSGMYEENHGELVHIKAGGRHFYIRNRFFDKYILAEDIILKQYEPPDQCRNPEVIFDIGSHIGTSALFFRLKFPHARIFCFEPMPDNFKVLSMNFSNDKYAQTFMEAVYSEDGEIEIGKASSNTGANSIKIKHDTIKAKSETLPSVMKRLGVRKIDILKIDTEGCEVGILSAVPVSTLKKIKVIMLEYHSFSDKAKLIHMLSGQFELVHESISAAPWVGLLKFVNKSMLND